MNGLTKCLEFDVSLIAGNKSIVQENGELEEVERFYICIAQQKNNPSTSSNDKAIEVAKSFIIN